jgi:hypothetical protein
MPYGILILALVGLTPAVIVLAAIGANLYWIVLTSRLRTVLTVPVRIALVLAIAISAAACGGGNTAPSSVVTPPSAPYSQVDLREGTGIPATLGRSITVAYTGWLYDPSKPDSKGTAFDSSNGYTLQFTSTGIIQGWVRGVAGMKVGGQRRLIIPPDLGYGSQMVNGIPPNSTLVFEITLLNVL